MKGQTLIVDKGHPYSAQHSRNSAHVQLTGSSVPLIAFCVVAVVQCYFRHLLTGRKLLVRGQMINEITLSGTLIDTSLAIGQPGILNAAILQLIKDSIPAFSDMCPFFLGQVSKFKVHVFHYIVTRSWF